jgi:hypothetical protein
VRLNALIARPELLLPTMVRGIILSVQLLHYLEWGFAADR